MAVGPDTNVLPWHVQGKNPGVGQRRSMQTIARALLEDSEYRERFKARLISGELAPVLEAMLYHYAYGKPIEQIVVQTEQALPEDASLEEMHSVANKLLERIQEARDLRNAIPAEYFAS